MKHDYPSPTSPQVTAVMRGNRRTDTRPEVRLRSELHGRGLRFRKDFRIDTGVAPVRADIVFTRPRVAVFVDGCFWHGCPEHGRVPRGKNAAYWSGKMQRNRERDSRNNEALAAAGWRVIRVWEHESAAEAANHIQGLCAAARHGTVK